MHKKLTPKKPLQSLAFGDSYTYIQGTLGRQNYSFIGDAFDYAFTPAELLRNEIVQDQVSGIDSVCCCLG